MNLKEFSTAISYWEKLAEYNPNDVNVQNNIGVCFMGLNVPEQAKEVWEKALMLDPTSEILKKNLEHLQHG
jgi:tetratricopeptide (TPR) repeat protein